MVSETSARPRGLRPSVPLKITSAISPPRNALADCSPRTQRMASETFDLPQPLGPTIAVTPGRKLSEVLSANDLKPRTVRFFRYILQISELPGRCRDKSKNHNIWGQVIHTTTTNGRLVFRVSGFAFCVGGAVGRA